MATLPRQNKIEFQIPVFDGGKNSKQTDIVLPTNQSPDLQNVSFDDLGAVGTVYGFVSITATIGSAPVDGLYTYRYRDGEELLAVCNGSMWKYSAPSWITIASSQDRLKSGFDTDFIQADDYVIVNNGGTNAYRYNGTNFEQYGVPTPAGLVATMACSSNGTLTGTYNYVMTGINRYDVEGDYSTMPSQVITVASGEITITGLPVFAASAGVTSKYLYRNTAAGASIFYRVTALTAAQTTYVDNNDDSLLVTEAPDDNGLPPVAKSMVLLKGRVFAAGNGDYPYRLYWSTQGTIETWPSTNFTDIGKGDGEPITGLMIYANSLFVHKNNGRGTGSVWLVNMPDSLDVTGAENWYVEKLSVNYGSIGYKVLCLFSNLQFYLNRFGAYALAGKNLALNPAASEVGQFPVEAISYYIEPDVFEWNTDILSKSAATVFNNKVYISVPSKRTSTENDRIYIYDFIRTTGESRGAWSYMTQPQINCFAQHENDLYGGSALADGKVYKLLKGRSADGSAIDSYYWTPQLYGMVEHRDNTKVFRYIYLLVECMGDWDVDITYVVDYKNESTQGTTETINIDGDGGIWDGTDSDSQWDEMVWDNVRVKKLVKIVLQDAVGKSIKVRFRTNTANQWFKIHNMTVSYNLRSNRVGD